jgi:hypothetical protein
LKKDGIRSIISLVLALFPLVVLGYGQSNSLIEQYKEVFWALSFPGFLYFIKYEVVRPMMRDELVKPLRKIIVLCIRALRGEEDAIRKLQVLETLE